MSKYCPDCGAELPDDLKFCISCGKKLPSEKTVGVTAAPHTEQKDEQAAQAVVFGKREPEPAVSLPLPEPAPAPESKPVWSAKTRVLPRSAPIQTAEADGDAAEGNNASVYCADCGAKLAPGLKFCINCGQKISAEPAGGEPGIAMKAPAAQPTPASAADVPSAKQDYISDPHIKNILEHFSTRRMLLKKLPFVAVMAAFALFVIPQMFPDEVFVRTVQALLYAFTAWRVFRQPAKYAARRKRQLITLGYNSALVDRVSKENPIFSLSGGKKPDNPKALGKISAAFFVIGWVLIAYGLFAAALPIVIHFMSVMSEFGSELFIKGLHILTIGFAAAYVGKILRGISKC